MHRGNKHPDAYEDENVYESTRKLSQLRLAQNEAEWLLQAAEFCEDIYSLSDLEHLYESLYTVHAE